MSQQDWGHGPNPPVPCFTEAQIRAAMATVMHSMGDQIKIEAVLTRLRES